jgi:hypothetical protein
VHPSAPIQDDLHDDIVNAVDEVISQPDVPPEPPAGPEPDVLQTISELAPGKIYLYEKGNDYDALITFTDQLQRMGSGLLITSLASQIILRFLPPNIIAEIAGGYQVQGRQRTDFRLLYFSDKGDSETTVRPSNIERVLSTIEQYATQTRNGVILMDGVESMLKATSVSSFASLVASLKIRLGPQCSLILGLDKNSLNERDLKFIEKECDFIVRR